MKKFLLFLLALILLTAIFFAYIAYQLIQGANEEDITISAIENISNLEDIVQPYIINDKTKALSIGIYQKGSISYHNFGHISDKEARPPNQQSVYEIGSITKTFTSAVLAQMVAEGKVQLSDPISKFLPKEIINWSPDTITITLGELATHQSGLPRLPSNLMFQSILNNRNPYKNYSQADLYDYLKTYTPKSKPKRKVAYSNLGMGLLGNILADIDGVSYEALIQKRILQPIGMNQTFIDAEGKEILLGHNGMGKPTPHWDIPALAGAGAIRSNTEDMMAYLVANITDQAPFAATHIPQASDKEQQVGLAWWIAKSTKTDLEALWHNGGTGGFRTFMGFDKTAQIGVVVLSNTTQSVDAIGMRTLQLLERNMQQEAALFTE